MEGPSKARPARPSIGARSCLVLAGVVLGLVAVEIALRLTGAAPGGNFDTSSPLANSRWIAHPFLPYAGRPNSRFELFNGPEHEPETIVTNSYGFRAHEFPMRKGENDYFVLALGGSTTYGYRVASNDLTWPEILERKLAERYPAKNIAVFNMGVDMGTNAVALVNLALVGVHLEPDLVIEYEGFNDFSALGYRNFRTDQAHFYRDIDPQVLFPGFQRSMPRWLLRSYVIYRLAGALDLLWGSNDLARAATMPVDRDSDRFRGLEAMLRNLKSIDAIARGYGARALFSTFQFTRENSEPALRRFNEELRRYFDSSGLAWVDQASLIADGDSTINVDECHFTAKGNEMLAANFFRYIVEHGLIAE